MMLSNDRPRLALSQLFPRRALATLSLGACLALTSASRPSGAQSDADTEVARERFREGVAHYDRQEYEKARLAFSRAYQLKPHPAVLLNLAQSELRAGRYADSAQNFAKYLRENPSAPATQHARSGFEEARQRVTELNVQVDAADATVTIDGADAGRSPLASPLYLMPGRHTVTARKDNASAEKVLDAVAGRREYIMLDLQEGRAPFVGASVAGAAPVGGGGASAGGGNGAPAGAEPWADQGQGRSFFGWIGSSTATVAAVSVAGLALGTSAVLAGFANNRYAAANDARSKIMVALQNHVDDGVVGVDTVPCGANGVANGVVQFGPGVPQRSQETLVSQYRNACNVFTERSDSGDRLKTLSLVSLGVGAFAAIGTIVWYFSDSEGGGSADAGENATRRSATLTPVLSPDTQGLVFDVSF